MQTAKKKRKRKARAKRAQAAAAPQVEVLPAEGPTEEVVEPEEVVSTPPARASKDVVPYDALTAYLREIRQYPKLSREEEHELAVRYHRDKDLEAAYQLVSSNLWLV